LKALVQNLFIEKIRNSLPVTLKTSITGLLYHLFNFIGFGVRHVDGLILLGKFEQAKTILDKMYADLLNNIGRYRTNEKQHYQFHIMKRYQQLGLSYETDPLLEVVIEEHIDLTPPAHPSFKVIKKHSGILITGKIPLTTATELKVKNGQKVEIFINQTCIRIEKLAKTENHLKFDFTIKRPTLFRLPKQSQTSIKLSNNISFLAGGKDSLHITIPDSRDDLLDLINQRGSLDKKGYLKATHEEVLSNQEEYLKLYCEVNEIFKRKFDRPLFVLYGTLLGLYRDGKLIPGDDDFDVGYVSHFNNPKEVKEEVKKIILALTSEGIIISINRRGKPFRICKRLDNGSLIHLDARPVWQQSKRVWAHKQACLNIDFDGLVKTTSLNYLDRFSIELPLGAEDFLKAYYGHQWNIPDPSFSNSSLMIPLYVKKNLKTACLSMDELVYLRDHSPYNCFYAFSLASLYPIDAYEKLCGWH
jgi:hypothetical protein